MKKQEMMTTQQQEISEKEIKDYLVGSWTNLTDQQFRMFLGMAKAYNLNPFKREIYVLPFKNQQGKTDISIVTWYQVYLEKATLSWKLNWREVETLEENNQVKGARITIYRKDFDKPFMWFVDLKEFNKTYWSWTKMPRFMIKKVAIGQWFRLAFPEILSWMPYLAEEMAVETEYQVRDVVEKEEKKIEEKKEIIEEKTIEKQENAEIEELKKIADEQKASFIQKRKIFAMWGELKKLDEKYSDDYIKEIIKQRYNIDSRSDLTIWQASKLIEDMQKIIEKLKKTKRETEKEEKEKEKTKKENDEPNEVINFIDDSIYKNETF